MLSAISDRANGECWQDRSYFSPIIPNMTSKIAPPAIAPQLEQQRQEFPGLANKLYFNFGGQGALPRSSLESIIDAHNFLQQQGPFSLRVNQWVQQKIELLRKDLANELDVLPETIALTENVTNGCNVVLWGLDWQAGDRILLTDCEHPGIMSIVKEVAHRFGVEVATCPMRDTLNGGDPVALIEQYLTPQTRLVILSHVFWNTGQVLPLSDIVQVCHQYQAGNTPVLVLVDAAQSVGCLSLNLAATEVDFYAFTGHKWLCGPAGVGGLYLRPAVLERVRPTFMGWRGIELDDQGQLLGWQPDARRFEVSTSAWPQYEGLRAAIQVHKEWGSSQERYDQICQLSAYLWQGLSEINGIKCLKTSPPQAGLVSFQVTTGMSHERLVRNLERQGMLVRTLRDIDCIRVCVHYFTYPAEIEQLIEAIAKSI